MSAVDLTEAVEAAARAYHDNWLSKKPEPSLPEWDELPELTKYFTRWSVLPSVAAAAALITAAEREQIYADIRARWRCPHDDPKEQADCYWQAHGEEIIRDLETARTEREEVTS